MHLFHPTHYYNSFGEHEPVLKIRDGDTVSTKTVDAGGWDERGDKVGVTTNPLTGPFHVEGTMPGDALEVRLESVIPNRNWAWSSNLLVHHVVSPQIAAAWPPSEVVRWKVDMSHELVYPEKPTAGLTNLKLAVRPFLGCFGLANPDGQALSSITSGRHGGNMDYQGFGPEASLLLGQAVEYEVANVCNPAYSVVCKLPKALLFSM